MSLAEKLRLLRVEKGVSLQVVADAVGVTKPHVWELEKGRTKNPSLDLLKKLANYYEVSLDNLAGQGGQNSCNERCNTLLRKLDPENMSESDWKIINQAIDFAIKLIDNKKT